MIIYVLYIYSALVWSSVAQSIALPIFALTVFDIGVYWPLMYNHEELELGARLAHDYAAHLAANNHRPHSYVHETGSEENGDAQQIVDSLKLDIEREVQQSAQFVERIQCMHRHYQSLCTGYFIMFSAIGYFLSKTSRYPPLLSTIYLGRNTYYCVKILFSVFMYHLACLPLIFVKNQLIASLIVSATTVAWTVCFYFIVTMEDVRWQHEKSVLSFLLYLNVALIYSLLATSIVPYLLPAADTRVLVIGIALSEALGILIIRVTVMRSRKISILMSNYGNDAYWSTVNRHWFGFAFEDGAEEQRVVVIAVQAELADARSSGKRDFSPRTGEKNDSGQSANNSAASKSPFGAALSSLVSSLMPGRSSRFRRNRSTSGGVATNNSSSDETDDLEVGRIAQRQTSRATRTDGGRLPALTTAADGSNAATAITPVAANSDLSGASAQDQQARETNDTSSPSPEPIVVSSRPDRRLATREEKIGVHRRRQHTAPEERTSFREPELVHRHRQESDARAREKSSVVKRKSKNVESHDVSDLTREQERERKRAEIEQRRRQLHEQRQAAKSNVFVNADRQRQEEYRRDLRRADFTSNGGRATFGSLYGGDSDSEESMAIVN